MFANDRAASQLHQTNLQREFVLMEASAGRIITDGGGREERGVALYVRQH